MVQTYLRVNETKTHIEYLTNILKCNIRQVGVFSFKSHRISNLFFRTTISYYRINSNLVF